DLVGFALQRVIGGRFDEYVQREILSPLGMKRSGYWLAGRPAGDFGIGYASVTDKEGKHSFVPAREYWAHKGRGRDALDYQITCPNYPSGCMHTTAAEFANLMIML